MNLPPPSGEMPCYPPPAFSGHEFSASAAADPTELTITRPLLEEALAASAPGDRFQFVRTGYFVKDTKYPNTFNRIVGLKDSYLKK